MPPEQLNDFDLNQLSSGYDPVGAVEASIGATETLPESDETVPAKADDDDPDNGGDTPEPETGGEEDDVPPEDDTPDGGDDIQDPPPAAASTEEGGEDDDPLVPGVDNSISREQLSEKTQERIRSLAARAKQLDESKRDLERQLREYHDRISNLEKGGGATQQDSADQVMADMQVELDLSDDDIKAMFDKAVDGDLDTATGSFKSMMQAVAKTAAMQAAQAASKEATQQVTHRQQLTELQSVVEKLTTDYSVLDPSSNDFDEALSTEVRELRDFYIQRGETYAKALNKAAEITLSQRGLWGETDVLKPETPPVDKTAAAVEARNKKEAQRKLNTDQPPPPTGKKDVQTQIKKSILDYTDEEFDKLTDAELERMTGTQY